MLCRGHLHILAKVHATDIRLYHQERAPSQSPARHAQASDCTTCLQKLGHDDNQNAAHFTTEGTNEIRHRSSDQRGREIMISQTARPPSIQFGTSTSNVPNLISHADVRPCEKSSG